MNNQRDIPQREKYFSEKSDTEKIEMLKNELKRTQKQVQVLCSFVENLLKHEHVADSLFVPLHKVSQEYNHDLYFHLQDFK